MSIFAVEVMAYYGQVINNLNLLVGIAEVLTRKV